VHRAGAAESGAAAVFGAGQCQFVAKVPKKRRVRIAIELTILAIDVMGPSPYAPGASIRLRLKRSK
jgi:hypothetical protein